MDVLSWLEGQLFQLCRLQEQGIEVSRLIEKIKKDIVDEVDRQQARKEHAENKRREEK